MSTERRRVLRDLFDTAVTAVQPSPLTARAVGALPIARGTRVHIIAVGKASVAMAGAAVAALDFHGAVLAGGVVVAPEARQIPSDPLALVVGDHPAPGARSLAAAARIEQAACRVCPGDVALVLVSGGTSSLIAAPVPGVPPDDLIHLFARLDRAGLGVIDMNAVRRRFLRWGAGRLALALSGAPTFVLVLSDVPGDDPADVGSGPCAADASSIDDVTFILDRAGLLDQLPAAMHAYLDAVRQGRSPDTPRDAASFAHVSTQVVASNALAVNAVVARALALGIPAHPAREPLAGEAASQGARIAHQLLLHARTARTGGMVWGGETTVTRSDASAAGIGGRCQELALSAARVLADAGEAGEAGRRVSILAAGTDGRDGPTDAAGAFADASVWPAILAAGIDPARALREHESYPALRAAGALLQCGLTGTNVMDVVIGVVG